MHLEGCIFTCYYVCLQKQLVLHIGLLKLQFKIAPETIHQSVALPPYCGYTHY